MLRLKNHIELLDTGWSYFSSIYEHSFITWDDGTPILISENMIRSAEWFSEDDRDILDGFLLRGADDFYYLGNYWHESMFKKTTYNICEHNWINVSFSHIILVCKNCNKEK